MNTLILGGSGRIGSFFYRKDQYLTYRKNKINKGIYFDLTKQKISKIIKKFNINKVVFLSAVSDTDFC
jgi:dTDP-4-dehydrorhamnose reductase